MNSLYTLLTKPASELTEFEKKVVDSQQKAMQAKKDLEAKVGETSFGKKNIYIDQSQRREVQQQQFSQQIAGMKRETASLFYGLWALRDALLYLTVNKSQEVQVWQFAELLGFVKEHYPQTVYGFENIRDGTSLIYKRISKVVEENTIPVSLGVQEILDQGTLEEHISEIQQSYMHHFNLDEHEALKMAQMMLKKSVMATRPEASKPEFN
jgi:hypothetical protein